MENTKYTAEEIVKAYDVCRDMESLMTKFNPTAKSVTCEIGNGVIHAMILDSNYKTQFYQSVSINDPSKMFELWDIFLALAGAEKKKRIAELEKELETLKSE